MSVTPEASEADALTGPTSGTPRDQRVPNPERETRGVIPRAGSGKTGKRQSETILKEEKLLQYRLAGVSLEEAGRRAGYASRGAAHTAMERALKRHIAAPAEEMRQLEGQRLDTLQMSVWNRALSGDLNAVDRVIAISRRRAALFGLDQPQEVRLTLEAGQVDFLEKTIRDLTAGFFAALATAGHEQAAADVSETILGEVVPRALGAAAEIAS